MARYRTDGTFYIKFKSGYLVGGTGSTASFEPLWGKLIPPLVAVNRVWTKIWITGASPVSPVSKQQVVVTGAMADLPVGFAGITSGDNDTMQEVFSKYLPIGSYDDASEGDTTQASAGVLEDNETGEAMSRWYKDHEFYNYSKDLGMPDAFMTKENGVRHFATHSLGSKGTDRVGRGCSIDQWRIIGCQAASIALAGDIQQSHPSHMMGSDTFNEDNLNLLAQQAYYFFGEQGVSPFYADINSESSWQDEIFTPSGSSSGAGVNEYGANDFDSSIIREWMTSGYGTSGSSSVTDSISGSGWDETSDLIIQTATTIECKIVKRNPRNIYTPV